MGSSKALAWVGATAQATFCIICGRVRLSCDLSEIKLVFSIRPPPNFPPSWNATSSDQLLVVCHDRKVSERSLDLLRWGLIPHWAKDINLGFAAEGTA